MLSLILIIIFGLGMAFFATQNTGTVHILLGTFMLSGVPLYIVVMGALLLGIFISWLISMTDMLSSSITLHSKDQAIKKANEKIEKLQEENKSLSIENARLSANTPDGKEDASEKEEKSISRVPSFFQNFRHNFG